jgi:hypothetical protein
MNFSRIILSLTLIIQTSLSLSQEKKVSNPLQDHEIEFLNILNKDTIHSLNIQLDSKLFSFGLNTKEFRNIALIKKGKDICIQPLGLGKLFK